MGFIQLIKFSFDIPFLYSRESCLIDEGDTFLLIGGLQEAMENSKEVNRYNAFGWMEDLDSLNTARQNPGCATFNSIQGLKVLKIINTELFPYLYSDEYCLWWS